MTRPPFCAAVIGHDLQIPDELLDDLLSALRRHDAGDAARLLDTWAAAERDPASAATVPWEDDDFFPLAYLDDELSGWVHAEVRLHVAGARFEHALSLVERYRRPLTAEDMANFNPTGAPQ